jgi:hypothetical protein
MDAGDSRDQSTGGAGSSLPPVRWLLLGALLLTGVVVTLLSLFFNSRRESTEGSAVAQPQKPVVDGPVANAPLSAPTSEAPVDRTAVEPPTEVREPEIKPKASSLPGMATEHSVMRLRAMRHSLEQMERGLAGDLLFDVANSAHSATALALMIELDVAGKFEVRDPAAALNPHDRTPRPPGTHMLAGGGRTYIINDADYPEYIALGRLCDERNKDAKLAPPTENELLYMRPVPAELIDAVRVRCARAESLLGEAAKVR